MRRSSFVVPVVLVILLGALAPAEGRARKPLSFTISEVTPRAIPVGEPVAVRVTAALRTGTRPPRRALLQRVDGAGLVLATLGDLHDDGQNGDETAGDGIYILDVQLNEASPGAVLLRVDTAKRVKAKAGSDPVAVPAVGDSERLVELLLSAGTPPDAGTGVPIYSEIPSELADELEPEVVNVFGTTDVMVALTRSVDETARGRETINLGGIFAIGNKRARTATEKVLEKIQGLGIDTTALKASLDKSFVVREGPEAGGVKLNRQRMTCGLTVVATLIPRQFGAFLDYDDGEGNEYKLIPNFFTHTIILQTDVMDDLLNNDPCDMRNFRLAKGAVTIVHELVHAASHDKGCFGLLADQNREESFTLAAEQLIQSKVEAALRKKAGQDSKPAEKSLVCRLDETLETYPEGRACIEALGFKLPVGMELRVSPTVVAFEAFEGQAPTPAQQTFMVSAVDPATGKPATICIQAIQRTPTRIIDSFLPGRGRTGTPKPDYMVSARSTNDEGMPLAPGRYLDFIDIISKSAETVTVTIQLDVKGPGVRLDRTLSDEFTAGMVICLSRVTGFRTGAPESGCAEPHIHALTPTGIMIDGKGPFPDPNPSGCGYGVIVICP